MLNRRLLRIKAMQAVYSYHQSVEANFHLAQDKIKVFFEPDWNADPPQDKKLLKSRADEALKYFTEQFDKQELAFSSETDMAVKKAVVEALNFYKQQNEKDEKYFQSRMLLDVRRIADLQYKLLLLPTEFSRLAAQEREKKIASGKPFEGAHYNLAENKAVKALSTSESLHVEVTKRNISWSDHVEEVRDWYREILKKSDFYIAYQKKINPSFVDDFQLLKELVAWLFSNETINLFFEDQDLQWSEDKSIVKGMLKLTLKSLNEIAESDSEESHSDISLTKLSLNWEGVEEFFKDLYKFTLTARKEYKDLILEKLKNWDFDRVALTDRIILEMSIAEMINFGSIPVKVSINEYIELSKNYSTPKSKQFINGMLDAISEELVANGTIRKSGRGLIDNK